MKQELELPPIVELVVERKLELWLEPRPLELEVQQELELPPTLELGEQRKLEPWLELLTLELEACQELLPVELEM